MTNNLTILVDGGFLMMRNLFAFEKGFAIKNSKARKSATAEQFKESLAQTITKILNQFPGADNVVLMSEGGSWRKNLPIPKQLEGTTYKGHRERRAETDWNAIYRAYGEFTKNAEKIGITHSQHSAIEGDDWAWYWSRRLNSEGINCVIWTSDCDLKQLVQVHNNSFTAWYNDNAGLVFPKEMEWPSDPIDAMLNPPFQSAASQTLTQRLRKVTYINPDMIVINKVLCGDAGDNIKSVVRFKKGTRTYRFADSDYKKFIEATGIDSLSEFLNSKDIISNYIRNNKKFAPYDISHEDIMEMLDYNVKLVWLNENVLPETVTSSMVQFEYNQFNVQDLKSNYKLLTDSSSDIENLFNEIS